MVPAGSNSTTHLLSRSFEWRFHCGADRRVVSLWSAGRLWYFLEEGTGRGSRLRIILNRYKKFPDLPTTMWFRQRTAKFFGRFLTPIRQFLRPSITAALCCCRIKEISRSIRALAENSGRGYAASLNPDRTLVYSREKADNKKKILGRASLSPLRAGQ